MVGNSKKMCTFGPSKKDSRMSTLKIGQTIGKYTVQNLIKENLYTETYRAEDEDNNPFFLKVFAIKRMPEKLVNPETGTVFEIEYCRSLSYRNLISYVDSGITETEDGTCQYYLTNYFSGELLIERIQREGRIAEEEAMSIFTEILSALQFLHQQNPALCHNDVTPRNIMFRLADSKTPELIDLGHVSIFTSGKTAFDTTDLDVFYSANETYRGIYDQQSDIFAATAVLYTMLTGQRPWNMEFPENAKTIRKATLLKDFRKEHPLDLEAIDNIGTRTRAILAKGLAVNFGDRYRNVEQILDDIVGEKDPEPPTPKEKNSGSSQDTTFRSESESPNRMDFEIRKGTGNGFKDIAGMKELKAYLTQRVIFVIKDRERAEKYRLTPPNGMLLYGPPGCGKTFVAEKFAEETGFNFALVKSSDLASSFLHGSQEKIAQLFKQAEAKAPVVLCFDEFDALVPDRSNPGSQYVTSEVNEFLTQLNNCSARGIFVVATSNRPDKIDPAVLRTGRIDKQVYVPLPDREARREMFLLHLAGRPYVGIDVDRLADLTDGYIASDIAYVVNDAAMTAAFTDQPISEEILEASVASTHPSLRKDTLRTFEDIRCQMEGIERRNIRPVGFTSYSKS